MIENFRLKVFRVVADTMNFRRAAEELHLTQPAITAQIRSLEESLGLALFDRTGREIGLTPAGEALLSYVRKIEAMTNEAIAALASFGGQETLEVSIGASHTIAVYLLPNFLQVLLREWPKLKIHITGGSTNEILRALTDHQIAIGFIEAPAFRPDLHVEAFREDELSLIVRPDHRWASKGILRAAELIQEPILLRETGSGMRRFVERYLEENGVLRQQLRTTVDINSTEGIISAVEAGLGVGFVPRVAIEKALQLGTIKEISLEKGPIRRTLSIALLNGPEPKGPIKQLLDLIREDSALQTQTPPEIANTRKKDDALPLHRGRSSREKHLETLLH